MPHVALLDTLVDAGVGSRRPIYYAIWTRGQAEFDAPEPTSCRRPQLSYCSGLPAGSARFSLDVKIPRSLHPQTGDATSCPPERRRQALGSEGACSRVQLSLRRSPPTVSHRRGPSALHEKKPSWDGGGGEPPGTLSALDSKKDGWVEGASGETETAGGRGSVGTSRSDQLRPTGLTQRRGLGRHLGVRMEEARNLRPTALSASLGPRVPSTGWLVPGSIGSAGAQSQVQPSEAGVLSGELPFPPPALRWAQAWERPTEWVEDRAITSRNTGLPARGTQAQVCVEGVQRRC